MNWIERLSSATTSVAFNADRKAGSSHCCEWAALRLTGGRIYRILMVSLEMR